MAKAYTRGADASELEEVCRLRQGYTRLVPMIESARALLGMPEIARASARVAAITVGSEDFSAELNMVPDSDSLYAPNILAVIAANAAGVLPLGYAGSIADFADVAHFRAIAERSRRSLATIATTEKAVSATLDSHYA